METTRGVQLSSGITWNRLSHQWQIVIFLSLIVFLIAGSIMFRPDNAITRWLEDVSHLPPDVIGMLSYLSAASIPLLYLIRNDLSAVALGSVPLLVLCAAISFQFFTTPERSLTVPVLMWGFILGVFLLFHLAGKLDETNLSLREMSDLYFQAKNDQAPLIPITEAAEAKPKASE